MTGSTVTFSRLALNLQEGATKWYFSLSLKLTQCRGWEES